MKRFRTALFSLIAAVGLANCLATTHTVKATSFNYYSTKGFYHFKHKVVLTQPITIRKEHSYGHSFYTYLKEKRLDRLYTGLLK